MTQSRYSGTGVGQAIISLALLVASLPVQATPATQPDPVCEPKLADDAYAEAFGAARVQDYRSAAATASRGLTITLECPATQGVRADLARLLAIVLEKLLQQTPWDEEVVCRGSSAVADYLESRDDRPVREQFERISARSSWRETCEHELAGVGPEISLATRAEGPTPAPESKPVRPRPLQRGGAAVMAVAGASLVGGVIFMGLVARDELERRRLGCDSKSCHEHWDRGKRNTQVEFAMFGVAVGLGIIGAILLGVDANRRNNASAFKTQPRAGLTGEGLRVRF